LPESSTQVMSAEGFPWIKHGRPAIVLAPMDGLTDAPMRAVHTELGGFSHTVSEFIRVAQEPPGSKIFLKEVPELKAGAITPSGCPVQVQLLGGDPERMANTALLAVALGARAIDINFGCPAPTVNRHDGGATLLKYPARIETVVRAIRSALPAEIPVSAKLRLGWDSIDEIYYNAEMAESGGASWITIHGRTRMERYQPPAHWEPIGEVRQQRSIPVIANGDIWSLDDLKRCRDITGCEHFMLGRGAIADPALARAAASELGITGPRSAKASAEDWRYLLQKLVDYSIYFHQAGENLILCRLKQWLSIAARYGSFDKFDLVKRSTSATELFQRLGAEQALCTLEQTEQTRQRTGATSLEALNLEDMDGCLLECSG
jgi:tRNA-dihydrouridine synthase C